MAKLSTLVCTLVKTLTEFRSLWPVYLHFWGAKLASSRYNNVLGSEGFMRLLMSLVLLFGGVCVSSAFANEDTFRESTRTYLDSRRGAERIDLDEDLRAIREQLRETTRRATPQQQSEQKDKLDKLKAEARFVSTLKSLPSRIKPKDLQDLNLSWDDLQALEAHGKKTEAQIEAAIVTLSAPNTPEGPELVQLRLALRLKQGVSLGETGFKIVPVVEDKNGKKLVSFQLEMSDKALEKIPKSIREHLTDDDLRRISSDSVGRKLGFEFEVSEKTSESDLQSMKKKLSEPKYSRAPGQTLSTNVDNRLSELGGPKVIGSEIAEAQREFDELVNPRDREQATKALTLKLKVADWLRSNQRRNLSECEIMARALGSKDGKFSDKLWSELSDLDQQECIDHEPAKRVEVDSAVDQEQARDDAERLAHQQETLGRFQQAIAQCESARRQSAITAETKLLTDPIEKLFDALLRTGQTSAAFAELDRALAGLADDPFADIATVEDTVPQIVKKIPDDKIQGERDAVEVIMKRAWLALQRSGSNLGLAQIQVQAGKPLDLALLQHADKQTQQMATWYNKAAALLAGIDKEIPARKAQTAAKLGGGPMVTNASQGQVTPMVMGGQGPSAKPGAAPRKRSSEERRQQQYRGPQGQRNSSGRTAPNYLGR